MNEVWYSKEYDNAPMPHAIFFMKDGHAIHGTYEVKALGKPVSHGCVRISPENAAILYELVQENGLENTKVVLTGSGSGEVARGQTMRGDFLGQHPTPLITTDPRVTIDRRGYVGEDQVVEFVGLRSVRMR